MRLAFAIVSLFPWGGLQRDCLRLARAARAAGHQVTIFAAQVRGDIAGDVPVELLPVRAITNHGRNRRFADALARATAGRFDRVVGFDKLPGLDVLYCGDLCFADRKFGFWSRLNPRVRAMIELEGSCFSAASRTLVLALADAQADAYRRAWHTPAERLRVLPPPIEPGRRHPEFRSDGTRERVRRELGLAAEDFVWLCVGAWAQRKGFDRAVAALAASPRGKLLVCGIAPAAREGAQLLAQARRLGVAARVQLLGPRDDVARLMAAADLLLHPARAETTGTVILEAVINGLPVIATEVCGFAQHVSKADAGIVLREPFQQSALNRAIETATDSSLRARWSAHAAAYGADPELYAGIERALQAICSIR